MLPLCLVHALVVAWEQERERRREGGPEPTKLDDFSVHLCPGQEEEVAEGRGVQEGMLFSGLLFQLHAWALEILLTQWLVWLMTVAILLILASDPKGADSTEKRSSLTQDN